MDTDTLENALLFENVLIEWELSRNFASPVETL